MKQRKANQKGDAIAHVVGVAPHMAKANITYSCKASWAMKRGKPTLVWRIFVAQPYNGMKKL